MEWKFGRTPFARVPMVAIIIPLALPHGLQEEELNLESLLAPRMNLVTKLENKYEIHDLHATMLHLLGIRAY